MTTSHELLDFDRRPTEYLGILPQFPISLGGKIFLVYVTVVQGPLYFNMLLECDYVLIRGSNFAQNFKVLGIASNRMRV